MGNYVNHGKSFSHLVKIKIASGKTLGRVKTEGDVGLGDTIQTGSRRLLRQRGCHR